MKKYFTTYLPVKGEITIGDKFKYDLTKTELMRFVKEDIDSDFNPNKIGGYKFKLFLCTNEVMIGDKDFYVYPQAIESKHINNVTFELVNIIECEGAYKVAMIKYLTNDLTPTTIGTIRQWPYQNLFKVVGEINDNAKWIKEGDKFDKEELLAYGHGLNWNEYSEDMGNLKFKIKCPTCENYH